MCYIMVFKRKKRIKQEQDYEYSSNSPILSHDNDMFFASSEEQRRKKMRNILDW